MELKLNKEKHYDQIVKAIADVERFLEEDKIQYTAALGKQDELFKQYKQLSWWKKLSTKRPVWHMDPRFPEPETRGSEIRWNIAYSNHITKIDRFRRHLDTLKIMKDALDNEEDIYVSAQDYLLFKEERA